MIWPTPMLRSHHIVLLGNLAICGNERILYETLIILSLTLWYCGWILDSIEYAWRGIWQIVPTHVWKCDPFKYWGMVFCEFCITEFATETHCPVEASRLKDGAGACLWHLQCELGASMAVAVVWEPFGFKGEGLNLQSGPLTTRVNYQLWGFITHLVGRSRKDIDMSGLVDLRAATISSTAGALRTARGSWRSLRNGTTGLVCPLELQIARGSEWPWSCASFFWRLVLVGCLVENELPPDLTDFPSAFGSPDCTWVPSAVVRITSLSQAKNPTSARAGEPRRQQK